MSPRRDRDVEDGIAEALGHAFPVAPPLDLSNYVTRQELSLTVKHLETSIENAELKQRNWVLGGCVALLLTFGVGWATMYAKIDRMTEQSSKALDVLEERGAWMARIEEINRRQDASLHKTDKEYEAVPFQETPR